MKRTILLAAAAFFFSAHAFGQNTDVRQVANTDETQPYKIKFPGVQLGKPEYSKIILNAWKAYDENRLDDIVPLFSDGIVARLPDGTIVKGKEKFVDAMKAYRGGFASVVSTVDACTTMQSPSAPGRNMTAIWGTEVDTKKDGTTTRVALHELWYFDKDGLVTNFYQYATPLQNK